MTWIPSPEHDLLFMRLAIKEARKGQGRTSPNPCVGAVVVNHGKVVGRGYHKKAGTPHAEVHALRAAGERTRGATLYVTLEPCNHTGRTPPCTEAVLASGIARVVVGMTDPNPRVTGNGCRYLTEKGVEITQGLLSGPCQDLNRPFIKHCLTGLPWVILKAGVSLDGKIATRTGHSNWITNERSRQAVHRLRNIIDSILVGAGTVIADDPYLTTRLAGKKGHDPIRVVLDTSLRMPVESRMLNQESEAKTLIFCGIDAPAGRRRALEARGAHVIPVPYAGAGQARLDLTSVLHYLGEHAVISVLVEGGSHVHGSFLRAGLVDEVAFFMAPVLLGADGIPVMAGEGVGYVQDGIWLSEVRTRRFGDDILIMGRPGKRTCLPA